MLHELLLALSGHPSPLLYPEDGKPNIGHGKDLLSPAEATLLSSLSRDLGQKHRDIRDRAGIVSKTHPSTVCRAVCASILSVHLQQFQRRILEVERQILDQDSQIAGAYNIVPLSRIVGAFDGWKRKLDWLWKLVLFIEPDVQQHGNQGQAPQTSSHVIRYLREATNTGYPDIEKLSLELVRVAETTWLKQLSTWVLYGRLPSPFTNDFLITPDSRNDESLQSYSLRTELIPPFVTPSTASSILFIGKSLHHIREMGSDNIISTDKENTSSSFLVPEHLAHLASLASPISALSFTSAINAIRLSLSQNALLKLLPLPKVLEILRVFKDFFLLERGEFATALVSAADDRLSLKSNRAMNKYKQSGSDGLNSVILKEGEVAAILRKAWATIASSKSTYDDFVDEELDLARDILKLSLDSGRPTTPAGHRVPADHQLKFTDTAFNDLIVPTPTTLSLRLDPPLDLFLSPSDITAYSHIHSYLLSLRRAHFHLGKVFQLSALRRHHPSPRTISTHISNPTPPQELPHKTNLAHQRAKSMRPIWATIGSAIFFLAELGAFFHGEVIALSWSEFFAWLDLSSSEKSALNLSSNSPARDPETITLSHRRFLSSLRRSLLLTHSPFTTRLKSFLKMTDHTSALMNRLDTVQQQQHTTTFFTDFESEEKEILDELKRSCASMDNAIVELVAALRDVDARSGGGGGGGDGGTGIGEEDVESEEPLIMRDSAGEREDIFIPRITVGLDRLLLRLDYTTPLTMAAMPLF
ncbi:MAG: hypothetical protein Q9190_005274 [Brigantiaea leucoxantha]